MNEIELKIIKIAQLLGDDWVYNKLESNPDRKEYVLTFGNTNKVIEINRKNGAYNVRGLFQNLPGYRWPVIHRSISISIETRTTQSIVNDIKRRLLSGFHEAYKNKIEEIKASLLRNELLTLQLDAIKRITPLKKWNDKYEFDINGIRGELYQYHIRPEYDLNINNLSPDNVIRILAFMKTLPGN